MTFQEATRNRYQSECRRQGVDLVLDFVVGAEPPGHVASLKERGRLVLVGLLAGPQGRREPGARALAAPPDRGLPAPSALAGGEGRPGLRLHAFALPRLKDGRLKPIVDRVMPFEQAAEAYRALERGGVFGKVVLSMA